MTAQGDSSALEPPSGLTIHPLQATAFVLAGLVLTTLPYLLPLYHLASGAYVPAIGLRLPARYLVPALWEVAPWTLLIGVALAWRRRAEIAVGMFVTGALFQLMTLFGFLVGSNSAGLRAWLGNALFASGAVAFLAASRPARTNTGVSTRDGGQPPVGLVLGLVLAAESLYVLYGILPLYKVQGLAGYHDAFVGVSLRSGAATFVMSIGTTSAGVLLGAWWLVMNDVKRATGVFLSMGLFALARIVYRFITPSGLEGRQVAVVVILSQYTILLFGAAAILVRRPGSSPVPERAEANPPDPARSDLSRSAVDVPQ